MIYASIIFIIIIIIIIIIKRLASFSHQSLLLGFHWSLSDCKSPQISRPLLSILLLFSFFEFFTPALADGFPMEFE